MATKKNTKQADEEAEQLADAEARHPSTDGYENADKPHRNGDPLPRNKRKVGDGAHMLSAQEVADGIADGSLS